MSNKGGDFGGRRPRSPAITLATIGGLRAIRPDQLRRWTMDELRQAEQALRLAASVFTDEQARRFDAADEIPGEEI